MGFTTGAKILANIIDEMANGLIATSDLIDGLPKWSDADTTWNTTDKTLNNARRALRYLNGTEEMYITLEAINTNGVFAYYSGGSNWNGRYTKGLRVGFSASWDSITHVPSSTTYRTFVEFEGQYAAYNDPYDTPADMAILQITYYLWVESNGFVITGKPEPYGNDNRQGSFVVVLERSPNKEYADGATNFFCYNLSSYLNYTYDGNYPANNFMRPFLYQTGNLGIEINNVFVEAKIYPEGPRRR